MLIPLLKLWLLPVNRVWIEARKKTQQHCVLNFKCIRQIGQDLGASQVLCRQHLSLVIRKDIEQGLTDTRDCSAGLCSKGSSWEAVGNKASSWPAG